MKAIHLQTEYLTEPLGIDLRHPRFYWNCEGGTRQSAYQIRVETEKELLWDSGKVESSSMTHIRYGGRALQSREEIFWSVCLWDEKDQKGEWTTSRFEMGLLRETDWTAKWISGDYIPKKNQRYPVDHFRKEFGTVGTIKKARLYASACGLYEARLNGKRVGTFVMAPGCTDYRKRIQYQTYDVTKMLQRNAEERQCAGEKRGTLQTLELELADGWFRGSSGCYGVTNVYGRRTSLICQLELTYEDGKTEVIGSDRSFRWSNDGPVRFQDLKDGEVYDANRRPQYKGYAAEVEEKRNLTASNQVEVKEQEHFKAKLFTTPKGDRVLDFGQNIAGFVSFRIRGKTGQKIRLLMGEMLDKDGEFTQKNFQVYKPEKEFGKLKEMMFVIGKGEKLKHLQPTPKQEILFTCSGGEDRYKTSYAVFGFRYAKIETDVPFRPEDFEAIAVYSDLEQTGAFRCSNEKVNKLYENTLWSMKGNFLDIPTDCPTRERLGWTGDAQIFFDTGAYMMNIAPFFRKWMQDMADGMMKNGVVPAVVPYAGLEMMYNNTGASAGWGDAAVILPYRFWKRYGDRQVMETYYEKIARPYAEFMIAHTGHSDKKDAKKNPWNAYVYEKGMHLGEWLEPEEFQDNVAAGKTQKQTEVATAYFHYSMTLLSEMAEALGKKEEGKKFRDYAEGSKKAYECLYLKDGAPDTDRQAKLVRPLAFGLGDLSRRKALEKRLFEAAERRRYRIGTGFLSTPFVLHVLTEAGNVEAAYRMLENEEAPGWIFEINQGATTIWEDWEGTVSRNHYSPGSVCQWLFDTAAGIRIAGENHFQIEPRPGGSLREVTASYASLYGKVCVHWEEQEGKILYDVEIPDNTTAELVLPGGEKRRLTSGKYCLEETKM